MLNGCSQAAGHGIRAAGRAARAAGAAWRGCTAAHQSQAFGPQLVNPACTVFGPLFGPFGAPQAFSKYGLLRNCWVARKPPGFGFGERPFLRPFHGHEGLGLRAAAAAKAGSRRAPMMPPAHTRRPLPASSPLHRRRHLASTARAAAATVKHRHRQPSCSPATPSRPAAAPTAIFNSSHRQRHQCRLECTPRPAASPAPATSRPHGCDRRGGGSRRGGAAPAPSWLRQAAVAVQLHLTAHSPMPHRRPPPPRSRPGQPAPARRQLAAALPLSLPPSAPVAVEYEDRRDAEDAIRGLDGKNGWRVEFARAAGPKTGGAYGGGVSAACGRGRRCRCISGGLMAGWHARAGGMSVAADTAGQHTLQVRSSDFDLPAACAGPLRRRRRRWLRRRRRLPRAVALPAAPLGQPASAPAQVRLQAGWQSGRVAQSNNQCCRCTFREWPSLPTQVPSAHLWPRLTLRPTLPASPQPQLRGQAEPLASPPAQPQPQQVRPPLGEPGPPPASLQPCSMHSPLKMGGGA